LSSLEWGKDMAWIEATDLLTPGSFMRLWSCVLAPICGLAMMSPAVAQSKAELPPLPDLKFAEIGAASRDKFLGDRWSYMEAGPADAPPLVLLHGVGANSMHWRFQLAGLSDRFRVVAWNAPGYVLSDAFKTDTPGCKDFADALADFLAALKLDRVNIVGNSFGTRVAQCFAVHYPARIIKLALTGTGIGPRGLSEDDKKKVIATREAQIGKGGYAFGARVSALLGAKATPDTIELVRSVVRATSPRGFMHGVKLGLADGYSPEEVAGALSFPVLMISGSEDRINPIDKNAAILLKVLRNGKLEVLDGIGHLPEVEAPDVVNRMLRNFFAE
jgi:pimeloyl-ACP methyl ester carboxylesterase